MQKVCFFFIMLCLVVINASCSSSNVAEPVFVVTEENRPQTSEPPITVKPKVVKKKITKKSAIAQTPDSDEVQTEEVESSQAQDIFLAQISTDYTDRTYDLKLQLNAAQEVTAIKTVSNKNRVKNYPVEVLGREIVLVKAVGVPLVTLYCKNFAQKQGCPIEIEYPSNITYGKFLRFQANLVLTNDGWQLQNRERHFTRMHLIAKKVFGLLIGVERIELR